MEITDEEMSKAQALVARGSQGTLAGSELLDDLHRTLTKYVVLPSDEAVDAVVLWITATHGLAAFEHATRLAVDSPVKRCGKSRLLEIIQGTAYSTVPTTNISVPALFRMIDAADKPPTLILDEADRLFGSTKKDEENRDLIAILNNGFREGSPTWRCVGRTQVPTPFSNYAMAALAGIGRKPDTIEDRAVNITMRRRMPGESISKFRLRTDMPILHKLRDRLSVWVASEMKNLELPVTNMPDELEDRAEDAWEPLLAVADAAGGQWPQRGRRAAVRLTRDATTDDGDQSLDTRLLADVRAIFMEQPEVSFLPTCELLMGLRKLDEAPWADFDLTGRKLAVRLGKFGVKPKHNTARTSRGYHLRDLDDSFGRYLASNLSEVSDMTPDQGERWDAREHLDGSTRPGENRCPEKSPGHAPNGTLRTDWTDTPTGEGTCLICGAPPARRGSFGWIACAHQVSAGLVPA